MKADGMRRPFTWEKREESRERRWVTVKKGFGRWRKSILFIQKIFAEWSGNDGMMKPYTYMNKVYTRDLIEGNKSIIYIYI